ncbi:MAG: ABC transporter ATP-binding protein [Candidatus Rokubacteria bacterium RIFCSPLOWO2_12_FULL_71_19]|nr:MAG: ABC transporter ATP-binding protein [Candidatus Rokubacteria bacterium RIFCSPLOWO2_12_FULL_71_19]
MGHAAPAAAGPPVMRAGGITLRFGGVLALSEVSIEVGASEILAIIGPNGAGKSCTLNCLNGFSVPQAGRGFFRDRDITGMPPHAIAGLGVGRTFQGLQLFAGLSVIDNLLTGRHLHMQTNALQAFLYRGRAHREELRERRKVEEIIDFLEIKQIRHRMVGALSYGLRKRVDLGRALAMEPRVLLMDEPMAGMNLEEKEDMARFVIDIREALDIPIVIVEHDMHVVMDIADRVVVLDWGHVIAEGRPAAIKRDAAVVTAYLGEEQRR